VVVEKYGYMPARFDLFSEMVELPAGSGKWGSRSMAGIRDEGRLSREGVAKSENGSVRRFTETQPSAIASRPWQTLSPDTNRALMFTRQSNMRELDE
jgi:hypothetical protein